MIRGVGKWSASDDYSSSVTRTVLTKDGSLTGQILKVNFKYDEKGDYSIEQGENTVRNIAAAIGEDNATVKEIYTNLEEKTMKDVLAMAESGREWKMIEIGRASCRERV